MQTQADRLLFDPALYRAYTKRIGKKNGQNLCVLQAAGHRATSHTANYYIAQALTGHVVFGMYLKRFNKREDNKQRQMLVYELGKHEKHWLSTV